ncbi:hypothetical protein JCM5353_003457 [Sporobolomyces roseus]
MSSPSLPPTTPTQEELELFEQYTHFSTTPPSPYDLESSPEREEEELPLPSSGPLPLSTLPLAPVPSVQPSIEAMQPTSEDQDSRPIEILPLPAFLPPLPPLPKPFSPPGVLHEGPLLSPSLPMEFKPIAWAEQISSVYPIKMEIARLGSYRLVKPKDPQNPTRAELNRIHSYLHYIRQLSRQEEPVEIKRDSDPRYQNGYPRTRNVQCVTLFRLLTEFHPTFRNTVPTTEQYREVMDWVCEAIDDERRFDDIFDDSSFRLLPPPPPPTTTRSRAKPKVLDDDAEYSPSSKKTSAGRKPKSLRAEVLTRSMRHQPY